MLRVFSVVVLLFSAAAMAAEPHLTDDSFDAFIADNEFALVMFFAPWCGHCKSLHPKFTEASDTAAKEGKFALASVDCTTEKSVCEKFGVKGYPTLKFFKSGKPIDYTGPRETAGILSWLEKKSGPPAVTLTDADAVKEFAAKAGSIIGYFSAKDSEAHKAFITAVGSSNLDENPAAQVFDSKLFDGKKADTVAFNSADGEKTFSNTDGDALAKEIFEATFPLVGEVDGSTFQRYVTLGRPLYLLFIEPSDKNFDQIVGDLKKVAAKSPEEAFTWINAVTYKAQVKGMGASGDVVPCIIRMSSFTNSNKPIVLEKENLDEAIMGEWVEGIASGKYKYTPKSEPVPESNDGPVFTLVGKNLDELKKKRAAGASLFIEFYAPWCGHCKSLAPIWKELGEEFADHKDKIIIAQVDATANDIEIDGLEVKGFPTLGFLKGGDDSKALTFSGTRDLKNLKEYVIKHTGISLDAKKEEADEKKEDL